MRGGVGFKRSILSARSIHDILIRSTYYTLIHMFVNREQVTVLVSVHNGAATLEKCLLSIFTQTFQSIAIVLIDDCSTDDTVEVANKVKIAFPNISFTILRNSQNLGLTKSLNRGLAIIDSLYTARIDADDWWHPEKIEKQTTFLRAHPEYGVVGCNYINYSTDRNQTVALPERDNSIRKSIIKRNPFAHSCVVFKTKLIRDMGGYDESIPYAQDYELWLRCMPNTKFYNLQEILCYRSLGQGISARKQKQQMWQGIQIQSKYIKRYHMPLYSYLYTFELFANIITPEYIKTLKRRFLA